MDYERISKLAYDTIGAKAVEALIKNNFTATYVKDRKEAVEKVLALIPADATVGMGGSWTTTVDLGLSDILEDRGNTVYNHNKPGITPETAAIFRQKQLTADIFITGTNALTLDGKLVNVDGAGQPCCGHDLRAEKSNRRHRD